MESGEAGLENSDVNLNVDSQMVLDFNSSTDSGKSGLGNNRDSHQLLEGQSFEAGKLSLRGNMFSFRPKQSKSVPLFRPTCNRSKPIGFGAAHTFLL